jgi:hypothetical protein
MFISQGGRVLKKSFFLFSGNRIRTQRIRGSQALAAATLAFSFLFSIS